MDDLFSAEQKVFDDAVLYSQELRHGAAFDPDRFDVFVKEYGRLLRQLRRATKVSDRATGNLHTSNEDLVGKVHFDALTGLYNRRFMEECLKRVIRTAARSGSCLSVMIMDVDFFKRYNDTYGHSEGDACLKAVAETIAGCLSRTDDFAVRYGGEEFVVVLPNTDETGARVIANKILEAIRARNIPHEKNDAAECVTISIGLTMGYIEYGHTGEDYIRRADAALYQSKKNGRNQYTYINFKEES